MTGPDPIDVAPPGPDDLPVADFDADAPAPEAPPGGQDG